MEDQDQPRPITLPPRFLAPLGKPRDYVDRPELAARGEPECVGPAILEDYAQVAQLHRSQQHALDVANAQQTRPMLSPHHRLADIRRRAKHAHVDLSHELHILERAIDKARLRGQPVAPGALARLEGLEALLDGVSLREDGIAA